MDAVRLAAGDELGEHRGQAPVAGGAADVVLARSGAGGVDDELVGVGVVGRGRAQRLHVRAVPGLGHREAARELGARGSRGRYAVWCRWVPRLATAPPKSPQCTPALTSSERSAWPEHLEGRDRGAEVALAAHVLGDSPRAGWPVLASSRSWSATRARYSSRVSSSARRGEAGRLELRAGLLADVGPASVDGPAQGGAQGAHGVSLGEVAGHADESPLQARSVRCSARVGRGAGGRGRRATGRQRPGPCRPRPGPRRRRPAVLAARQPRGPRR